MKRREFYQQPIYMHHARKKIHGQALLWLALVAGCGAVFCPSTSRAQTGAAAPSSITTVAAPNPISTAATGDAQDETPAAAMSRAKRALQAKLPDEAVAGFELLCDRGEYSAAASFNRGLAYALRIAYERPSIGDYGQAIAGFEEARLLADSSALQNRAQAAAAKVRLEHQRLRRERGLEPVTEPAPTFLGSLRESFELGTYTVLTLLAAACATLLVIAALRQRGPTARFWYAGALVAYAITGGLYALREAKRMHDASFQWAVVVGNEVRAPQSPSDAAGAAPAEPQVVPEGSLVFARRNSAASHTEIEWGRLRTSVPATSLRMLAEAP